MPAPEQARTAISAPACSGFPTQPAVSIGMRAIRRCNSKCAYPPAGPEPSSCPWQAVPSPGWSPAVANPFTTCHGEAPKVCELRQPQCAGSALDPLNGWVWVSEQRPRGGAELNCGAGATTAGLVTHKPRYSVADYAANPGTRTGGSKAGSGPAIAPSSGDRTVRRYPADAICSPDGCLAHGRRSACSDERCV